MKKGKKSQYISIATVLVGIFILLTPYVIAPVCDSLVEMKSGMLTYMKCHYTANVAILLGALIIIVGLLGLFKKHHDRLNGIIIGALGVSLMIIPQSWVIGVCASEKMSCQLTKTVLTVEGAVVVLLGILILFGKFSKEKA